MKSWLQIAFLALVLTGLGQAFWHRGQLPERTASHFDGRGTPNGWMSRTTYTTFQVATILFIAALIEGLVLLNARLPKEYINIPRRDYWLAPERAAATHAWMGCILLFMGCALMGFFIALFRVVYRANLTPEPRLDSTVWVLAGTLLVTVAASFVVMVVRFARRPTA